MDPMTIIGFRPGACRPPAFSHRHFTNDENDLKQVQNSFLFQNKP